MKRWLTLSLTFALALVAITVFAQQPPVRRVPPPRPHPSALPGPVPGANPVVGQHAAPTHEAAAEGEGKSGEAGAEGEGHAPKPINWIDFSNKEQPALALMFVNVLLLFGIYYKYGKTPISEGLKNRRATIAKEIEEAQRMQREAEARAAKYQEKLSHLEDELKETRETLKAAGEAERDRLIREAEEKASRMERDATFLVEQELKAMRADLTREAVENAMAAAEELLRKRITSSDQERLAEDYLAQLAARRPSGQERAAGASMPPAAHEGGE